MKTIVNLTAYILILLGLYSCNDDVFVDDFRTSDTEFTLDGNGCLLYTSDAADE